jgi:hypothetical protein
VTDKQQLRVEQISRFGSILLDQTVMSHHTNGHVTSSNCWVFIAAFQQWCPNLSAVVSKPFSSGVQTFQQWCPNISAVVFKPFSSGVQTFQQ